MINKRSGTKYPTFNEGDPERKIVSMCTFRDHVYVAAKVGVYRIENDELVRLKFSEKEGESHE